MTILDIDLPVLTHKPTATSAAPVQRLAALSGVKTQLTVVAGRAQARVGELLDLKEGAVLALDQALSAPLDILLGEHVIARGELVAVEERFGIRILEVAPIESKP